MMIAVVDDDADFAESVTLILERAGHRVLSAGNREDGLRLAQNPELEVLVLDVMMNEPDDGIAMAQDLRKAGFDKPILMMSRISRIMGLSYSRDNHVVIQTAPSPRAGIGEEFGLEPGVPMTWEMNTALRRCEFDKVFDTKAASDNN